MALPAPAPDRTCLVTGASSGIGVEIARELARRGHGITLVARREGPLRELADELADRHGVRTEVVTADLAADAPGAGLAAAVAERDLVVDVLVNNAGFSTMGPVHRSEAADEVRMVRTDVEAVVDLTSTFLPGMVERGRGAVLNVASTAAFQPLPGQAAYAASKAFVLSYGQAVRAELRGSGVSLTTLCPGPVETGFASTMGIGDEEAAKAMPSFLWVSAESVAAQAVAALDGGAPVVIPGTGNKVAAAAAYLTPRRLLMPILARQHPALHD